MTTVGVRAVDDNNQLWHTKENNKLKFGFTEAFIETVRDSWHVVPAIKRGEVKEKSPVMVVETNDELITLFTPVGGRITHFNQDALDFPDHLTADTVIMELDTDKKAKVEEEVEGAPERINRARFEIPPRILQNLNVAAAELRLGIPQGFAFNPVPPARGNVEIVFDNEDQEEQDIDIDDGEF